MHPDTAKQNLLQLRPDAFRQVAFLKLDSQLLLLPVREQRFAFELFGNFPAFVAIETEHERRRVSRFIVAIRHPFEMLAEQQIRHP